MNFLLIRSSVVVPFQVLEYFSQNQQKCLSQTFQMDTNFWLVGQSETLYDPLYWELYVIDTLLRTSIVGAASSL